MCQGIGYAKAKQLINFFGSAEDVYNADERDFLDIDGIRAEDIKSLSEKDLMKSDKIIKDCNDTGCRIVIFKDSEYPDRLKNIYDSPLVIYVKGRLPYIDDEPVVGVVGTRLCTPYGITVAKNTGYKLSQSGITVVTGLAKGIDTAATVGALKGGTCVIGVVGTGLNIVYPSENKRIFDAVIKNGAIISEYPPGVRALQHHFPARNRLISGLSLGIAVIEAPKKSGALITATRALEQGRDVFALPGNVDATTCEGSNALLREGAIPFMSADDIIDEYIDHYPGKIHILNERSNKPDLSDLSGDKTEGSKKSIDNNTKVDYIDLGNPVENLIGDEKLVVNAISNKSTCSDEIIIETQLPAQKVLAVLTVLEINGHIKRNTAGRWERTRPAV